jgi:hypothetical protein
MEKADMTDVMVHHNVQHMSDVSDILDPYHVSVIFHIPNFIQNTVLLERRN